MDFNQIEEARKTLGLPDEASAREIDKAFRNLVLRYHPDRCRGKGKRQGAEMLKKINHAKDVIDRYCERYRYSFREKDVRKNVLSREEYEHLRRFYDGWLGDLGL